MSSPADIDVFESRTVFVLTVNPNLIMKRIALLLFLTFGLFFKSSAQTEVTFYTNYGNFIVLLDDSIMPITAGNFKSLVDSQFYDGIIFHRIIDNFVIQGGDPLGTGFGGPGYTIQDEFVAGQSNVEKTLSMANTGQPNTGGSQFFINLKNNTFLDFDKAPLTSKHPVFGKVTYGWPVVQAIENVPVNSNDKPLTDVVMDSVRAKGSTLSLEEIEANKTRTAIYPNPVNSESILDLYLESSQEVSIELYDMNGRVLKRTHMNFNRGKTAVPLYDLGVVGLGPGNYILNISGKNTRKSEPFTISE